MKIACVVHGSILPPPAALPIDTVIVCCHFGIFRTLPMVPTPLRYFLKNRSFSAQNKQRLYPDSNTDHVIRSSLLKNYFSQCAIMSSGVCACTKRNDRIAARRQLLYGDGCLHACLPACLHAVYLSVCATGWYRL